MSQPCADGSLPVLKEPPCSDGWSAFIRWLVGPVPYAAARSLSDEPEAWSCHQIGREPYRIIHRRGVAVWVANCTYGMAVEEGRGNRVWGDVTMASTLGLSAGHHYLRHAADVWLAKFGPASTERAEAVITALSRTQRPSDGAQDASTKASSGTPS